MSNPIAINGFGRIGRNFLRAVLEDQKTANLFTVKAINLGPSTAEHVALLFSHDSVYGTFNKKTDYKDGYLYIDDYEPIAILQEPDPLLINWKKFNITWVIECSGKLTSKEKALQHCRAGAQKILISAPCSTADVTIVPGINDADYNQKNHNIVSLGSCTTNCLAHLIQPLHQSFKLTSGLVTTVHAYTNNQQLLDSYHKDPRRGRAAALNIIPTSTGAEKVISLLFPELAGKIKAQALRVPVANISLVDFSFTTEKAITKESINQLYKEQAMNNPYLDYSILPLVSSDFIHNSHSAIFDSTLTLCSYGLGKIAGWYDNEYGYSSRMKDFLLHNL